MAKDTTWRVIDDLSGLPVEAAELDAVEAFLMAAVNAILRGDLVESCPAPRPEQATDAKAPQKHAQEIR